MNTSFHCVVVPFISVSAPEPADKKKGDLGPDCFGALQSTRFQHLETLPRASEKALLFQVLRRRLSGSKRLWTIQALPSACRLTRAYPTCTGSRDSGFLSCTFDHVSYAFDTNEYWRPFLSRPRTAVSLSCYLSRASAIVRSTNPPRPPHPPVPDQLQMGIRDATAIFDW